MDAALYAFDERTIAKAEKLTVLRDVKENPENYLNDNVLGVLAEEFVEKPQLKDREEIKLLREAGYFKVFGRKHISSNAYQQMELAMSLPIAEKGALMPDAHVGYGLPIGGVLATEGAIIPFAVGPIPISAPLRSSPP